MKKRSLSIAAAVVAVLTTYVVAAQSSASAADPLLSQGRPATASSTESAAFPASNAVDGNPGTRWSSAFSDPQWLQVDLGGTATVSSVVLAWETAYSRTFSVQVSPNGSTWTTIKANVAGTGGRQSVAVAGSGRYVRMLSTARATQWGVSLTEFEVYGTGGGPTAPPTIPPGAVRVAEFLADCPYSHRLPDDPIVFPSMPGASHMHSFFGSTVTNAYSTVNDLLNANSNCNPSIDKSSYWIPTFYNNNVPVEPTTGIFYYLGEGVSDALIAQTQPLPLGLRIVAGNAKATGPNDNTISRWSCLHAGEVGSSHDFVTCPARHDAGVVPRLPALLGRGAPGLRRSQEPHGVPGQQRVPDQPPGGRAEAAPGHAVPGQRQPGRLPAGVRARLYDARRLLQRLAGGRDGPSGQRLHPDHRQVRHQRAALR
nr:hypothetical protein GCM10020092_022780 [Actinoplanes digitatis]